MTIVNEKSWWQTRRDRVKKAGLGLLTFLAGTTVFYVLMITAVIVSGWLIFSNVWLPLQQAVGLPAGIAEQNPALQSEFIQGINDGRVNRLEYRPNSYVGYRRFFNPAPTLTPTPLP